MAILFSRVETILAILVEGNPRNISVKLYFEIFPLVPEEMSFKGFSISSFGGHFVQQNHLSNDGRWSPKEHFCEIIMISGHWPTRRCCLKVFLFLALVAILFSRAKVFSNFGIGPITEGTFL